MGILFKNNSTSTDDSYDLNEHVICDNLGFFASETYKMLRTKVELSIPNKTDEAGNKIGKIIGMTSSVKGEGKTTTSINLAYTLAQTGHKVLLIEGDMRLPNIGKHLSLKTNIGLSNLLAGQCKISDVLQEYTSPKGINFWVLTSGDPPPAPSELLASDNMKNAVAAFSKAFDFVILDLPPVTVVTDPIVASGYVDGMIIVVRTNFCDKRALKEAVSQLEFSKTKILGLVLTSSDGKSLSSISSKYQGSYRKYRRYDYSSSEN